MKRLITTGALLLTSVSLLLAQGSQAANEALWQASRDGDTAGITAALAKGADVNAKSRYDVTMEIVRTRDEHVSFKLPRELRRDEATREEAASPAQ